MTTLTTEDLIPPQEIEDLIAQLPHVDVDDVPASYDDVAQAEDDREAQDDFEGLGAGGTTIRTPREAVKLGWSWLHALVFIGVGYCLRTMRSLFNVEPLHPDAETAYEEALHKHPETNPMKIPWGVLIWWTNGRYGHVALSLGRGRCLTTDFKKPGFLCVAMIADLAPWCRGTFRGWTEDINGVVVWKPKTAPEPYDIDDRIRDVKALLEQAIANSAPERRIRGRRKWLHQLEERRDRRQEENR